MYVYGHHIPVIYMYTYIHAYVCVHIYIFLPFGVCGIWCAFMSDITCVYKYTVCVHTHVAARDWHCVSFLASHLMYWGKVSQVNLELADLTNLSIQLYPDIPASVSQAMPLQMVYHTYPALTQALGIWILVPHAFEANAHWAISPGPFLLFNVFKYCQKSNFSFGNLCIFPFILLIPVLTCYSLHGSLGSVCGSL